MPRLRTPTYERKMQKQRLIEEVSDELGEDVTLARAVAHRKARNAEHSSMIPAREIDFSADEVQPIGVVLGRVDDYKVVRGATSALRITTSAREFGEILHDAARVSQSEVLAIAIYAIPRDLGLDLEDDEE